MTALHITIATSNPGKVREYRNLLSGTFGQISGTADRDEFREIPETGETFQANADLKAKGYFQQLSQPVLADDSGLCVPALSGKPGVKSARFAGPDATDEENNKKLLRELEGIPFHRRTAYFACCITLVPAEGIQVRASGRCWGYILEKPCGSGGFGYDPLFLPAGRSRTFGEMPEEEKNRISHRAVAARNVCNCVDKNLPDLQSNHDVNS